MESKIFFHADDYGISESQIETIYNCFKNGRLNSVSIMPNSPMIELAYRKIEREIAEKKIRCVIHLNFIEGYSCAPRKEVQHLVNDEGKLKCTFVSLLKANFSFDRKAYKKEIKKEIAAQIERVVKLLDSKNISIDSHQHFHMIPVVWEALMEVIEEEGYILDYIRIPRDPIFPILSSPKLWLKMNIINWVKWIVLRIVGPTRKNIDRLDADIPIFFGMFFTCQMEKEVVAALLPKYERIARLKNRDLELMFHPGAVYRDEELLDSSNSVQRSFYAAPERKKEELALYSEY